MGSPGAAVSKAGMAGIVLLLLVGCAQDQGSTLSCAGPDATGCEPLSSVYHRETKAQGAADQPLIDVTRVVRELPELSLPELEPARIVRVWLAPWEDSHGDLHDQQFLYLVMRAPRWQITNEDVNKEPESEMHEGQ